MTLDELAVIVDRARGNGLGDHRVVFGDMNGYVKVGSAELGYVEDIDEYIMEPCDLEDGFPVFMIGE